LRWSARKLGFERVMYKKRKLRCYFISNQESSFFESAYFQKMLKYIQTNTDHCFGLKQTASHLMLACEDVKNIAAAQDILEELEKAIGKETIEINKE
jgi:transcription-repair coupling factor (superfamily II helicase)